MGPIAKLLPCGTRLHLQHGPIDLIIGADGQRDRAFKAAHTRFATVLSELVGELNTLRKALKPASILPAGVVAHRMHVAAAPFSEFYVTSMAAVAGAVADEVLAAMTSAADLHRAYVNNGGDIALHLSKGATFTTAMQGHGGEALGQTTISDRDPIRGIATSGRHGRSLSLGIADSVTVLAASAAAADVAATLIANAVDLPAHPAICRRPAYKIVEDSDLGTQPVVVDCAALSTADCKTALEAGKTRAQAFQSQNLIIGAGLFLQGHTVTTSTQYLNSHLSERLYA